MALDPQVAAHYGGRKQENVLGVLPIEQIRAAVDQIYNDENPTVEVGEVRDFRIPGGESGKASGLKMPADEPGMTCNNEIPVRLYRPLDSAHTLDSAHAPDRAQSGDISRRSQDRANAQAFPIILYFHGGAFMIHNIASHDSICRRLARDCKCLVLSVGYRLAPEHPYPAAMEDAWAVLNWVSAHASELGVDPEKICTAGDSSGANICAALNWFSMDHGGPQIAAQFLYYGTYGSVPIEESPTVAAYGNGDYVLPREMLLAARKFYAGDIDEKMAAEQQAHEVVSQNRKSSGQISVDSSQIGMNGGQIGMNGGQIGMNGGQIGMNGGQIGERNTDWLNFAYLDPGTRRDMHTETRTLIVTAEYDPLRADGEAFATALEAAGSPVTLFQMTGMEHGFLMLWEKFDRASAVFSLTAEETFKLGEGTAQ